LKTKPKIGKLTENQAQYAFGKKIQQNKKSAGKLNGKTGKHIRTKTCHIFTKNAQLALLQ